MNLNCRFFIIALNEERYACEITKGEVPSRLNKEFFNGVHSIEKNDEDVRHLTIQMKTFTRKKIPIGIGEVFPNLRWISIRGCNVQNISHGDLLQFPHMEALDLCDNQLEKLQGGLFQFNKKLEYVFLNNNKIKEIAPSVLKGVENLKVFDISNNQNFDCRYDVQALNSMTLKEFNDMLAQKWPYKPGSSSSVMPSTSSSSKALMEIPATSARQRCNKKLHKDFETFLLLDEFKDFIIKVGDKNFTVHKFLLIARSATLANMIRNNPDVDELVLQDISSETFEIILKYIYKDETPKNATNAHEIFVAAAKLKIEGLKEASVDLLIADMREKNCLEFSADNINLGVKFDSNKLSKEALDQIKKHFPNKKLNDEILMQPEKLKTLIEAKKQADEAILRLEKKLKEFEVENCERKEAAIDQEQYVTMHEEIPGGKAEPILAGLAEKSARAETSAQAGLSRLQKYFSKRT